MRILDRYLVKNFLSALFYCLFVFVILFIIIDVFNNLDEFLKHGFHLTVILSYYLYLIPMILVQIVPISSLVAILFTLSSMSKHHEIVAIKASGVSTFHIISPYLFVGILMSFSVFLLNELVVPQTSLTSSAIMEGVIQKGKTNMEERSINNVTLYGQNNHMIFAREFVITARTLYDVVILESGPHQTSKSKLMAKKAVYKDGVWTFYDAMKYYMNRRGDMVGEPIFNEKIELPLAEKPEDFIHKASQLEFMNIKQLKNYIDQLGGSKSTRRLMVDLHHKIAFPFVSFIVILIGAPLAMTTGRSSGMLGIGTSLLVVVLYYAINSICLALGKGEILPPLAAAWLTNVFFAGVGIYLIRRVA